MSLKQLLQDDSLEQDALWDKDDIKRWYQQTFNSLGLPVNTHNTSLATYTWAFAIACTRVFSMPLPAGQGPEGGGMVPIMDMCSHDACSTCEHDFDNEVCCCHAPRVCGVCKQGSGHAQAGGHPITGLLLCLACLTCSL